MKAKAKKKVVKKAARKPKDPCGARLKNEDEHHHDYWQWQDEVSELQEPAVKLRDVMETFKADHRADMMAYFGNRDDTDEMDMYEDIVTAFNNLANATRKVEEAYKQMRQRYVANQRSYEDPKTKEWVQVSTGVGNTSLLSQYKDI
jgi:hypothetical protein